MTNAYVDLNEVKRIRPKFLYEPLLVQGVINLIAGDGGVGKSTLALDWIAKATRGQLPGDYHGRAANILVYSQEDSDSLLKSRLMAAGADLNRVKIIYKRSQSCGLEIRSGYTLPDDMEDIETALTDNSAIALVVDPITSMIAGDSNKRDDVRKSLDPLAALADRLDVTVIGLLHFNKGGGYASDKISGSHAFRDLCRSLILVAKDNDTQQRIATIDKSNYSQAAGNSYSFTLKNVDMPDDNGEVEHIGRVSDWVPSESSVSEVINKNHNTDIPASNDCEADLIAYLREHGGNVPSSQALSDLSSDWTRGQVRHAQQHCKIIKSERSGFPAKSTWTLADTTHTDRLDRLGQLADTNDSQALNSDRLDTVGPTVDRLEERCNTNDSEQYKPQSAQSAQLANPDHDIGTFLDSLPTYASGLNFHELESWQIDAIRQRRSGLWHLKAQEEYERRRQLPENGEQADALVWPLADETEEL